MSSQQTNTFLLLFFWHKNKTKENRVEIRNHKHYNQFISLNEQARKKQFLKIDMSFEHSSCGFFNA